MPSSGRRTGSGSPQDPDWFQNLRAADVAEVQVKGDRFRVRAHELLGGAREAMWQRTILAEAPEAEKFACRAGRAIPVAVLERLDAPV